MIVAIVVEHLEPAGSRPDERDVKCAATEVVNQPVAVAGEARARVRDGCGDRLLQERRVLDPGERGGPACGFALPRAGTSPAP